MNECYLTSVLGFERSHNQSNVKEQRTTCKSKVVIDPRERIGRVMRKLKGEILFDEQRTVRSKAWKQVVAGEKFIYHERYQTYKR